MAGINFLSRNLIDNSDITVDTGTENAQFPLSNIFNESTAVKVRFDSTTVILIIDLQENTEIDSVAVHGETNQDLGITSASYRYSINTDFTSSPVNVIGLNSENRQGFSLLSSSVVCRYVELTLTGGSFVELSNLFIGKRVNLPFMNITKTSFKFNYIDKSDLDQNDYGQVFVDKRNQIKALGGGLQFLTPDEFDQVDEILRRHGKSSPFWLIVDENVGSAGSITDALYRLTIYGYFQRGGSWDKEGGLLWSTNINLVQAG